MRFKLTLGLLVFVAASVFVNAGEIDGKAVLGSAVGAAAGSAIGSAAGGKEGAIIGGGLGGAVGAAVGSSESKTQTKVVTKEKVIYVEKDHHDNGKHKGHHKHR